MEQRADQQHTSHTDLEDHQASRDETNVPAGGPAAAFFQRVDDVRPREGPRRHEAGAERREQGGADGERKHRPVDVESDPRGRRVLAVANCRGEPVHRQLRQDDAKSRPDARHDQALGEHLPHEPPSGGAERGTHRQLLGAQRRPGELHVHHVYTGDQQYAGAKGQHGEECPAQRHRRIGLEQRLDESGGEGFVRIRIGFGEALGEGGELGVRLVERDFRPQRAQYAGEEVVRVIARQQRVLGVERNPKLLVDREGEATRHHTHDGGRRTVDVYGLADDVRRGSEVALPDTVSDDRNLLGTRNIVLGGEVAAEHRLDAEGAQEVLGDVGAGVAPWHTVDRDVHRATTNVGGQQLEGLLSGPELLEVHGGYLAVDPEKGRARRVDEIDAHQPRSVWEREAPEHYTVHHAEHGGDSADAEGQYGDGQRAEGFLPRQHTQTGP